MVRWDLEGDGRGGSCELGADVWEMGCEYENVCGSTCCRLRDISLGEERLWRFLSIALFVCCVEEEWHVGCYSKFARSGVIG